MGPRRDGARAGRHSSTPSVCAGSLSPMHKTVLLRLSDLGTAQIHDLLGSYLRGMRELRELAECGCAYRESEEWYSVTMFGLEVARLVAEARDE